MKRKRQGVFFDVPVPSVSQKEDTSLVTMKGRPPNAHVSSLDSRLSSAGYPAPFQQLIGGPPGAELKRQGESAMGAKDAIWYLR